MNLLLDTHVALWVIADDPKLSQSARALILNPSTMVSVSVATLWEIAIKHSLPDGRGNMPVSGAVALQQFQQAGFRILPIEAEHALAVEDLPFHHNDPFDRLLVAQALSVPLRLMTHDAKMAPYSDTLIRI